MSLDSFTTVDALNSWFTARTCTVDKRSTTEETKRSKENKRLLNRVKNELWIFISYPVRQHNKNVKCVQQVEE